MRLLAASAIAAFVVACAQGSHSSRISGYDVELIIPASWHRVEAADPGPVIDPRTLLVVGTEGVRPKPSRCQIAAYRIPRDGVLVVVVGWRDLPSSCAQWERAGRRPLNRLTAVRRPSFECFSGRGAVTDVRLGGKTYQVNVLVGDGADDQKVGEALAVARSFDLAR